MQYSIIVPVYNVENVLPRCIESILTQTVRDFELILIDDGSPDNSGAICDTYAAKDDRIRVIHQVNAGVSNARNAGLNAARGKRIVFVDSDDYLDVTFLQEFSTSSADLIIGGYTLEGDGVKAPICRKYDAFEIAAITTDDVLHLFEINRLNYACTKCFNGDIIRQHGLKFNTNLSLAEDTLFVVQYVQYCSHIAQLENTSYHYVRYAHETLGSGNLVSARTINRTEDANEQIYKQLEQMAGNDALPAMLHRMGEIYGDVLLAVMYAPEISYSFVLMLFRQKWFGKTLAHADELYARENKKFRMILKSKSAILFWIYWNWNHRKR